MKTKDRVLELLNENGSRYISGQEMADTLFVTRAAIWKAIKSLQDAGYEIDAVNNRGYRLAMQHTRPSENSISRTISEFSNQYGNLDFNSKILVFDEVESTNDTVRNYLNEDDEMIVVAGKQTKGRGRRGRSFFSPSGTGLYVSFLLKPQYNVNNVTEYTCMIAEALCRAIEDVTDIKPEIKWVNDIFLNDRKIAGILTEGITSIEDGTITHLIVGVGINIYEPYNGFPQDISKTAGALLEKVTDNDIINKLCGAMIYHFYKILLHTNHDNYLVGYRNRSMVLGQYIKIMQYGDKKNANTYAKAIGIDDECHLIVEYDDGKKDVLSTGEVSIVKY